MRNKQIMNNKGVMRILEAVVAATIILIVFSASTFLVQSSTIRSSQQRADLDTLGYNVLSQTVNSGMIEQTMESTTSPLSTQIRTTIQNALPLGIYFNFTISKYLTDDITDWVSQSPILVTVNNVDDDGSIFAESVEVSSNPTIYTSRNGNTYLVTLVLARAGGEIT